MTAGLHHVYVLTGTAFEIGFQHGATLAQEIVSEMSAALRNYSRARAETPESTLHNFRALYEPIVTELLPGAMDEVRGIAEGSGLSVDAAFFASYRDGTPASFADGDSPGEGCTAFACVGSSSATGGVVIGQTKDTDAPLERYRMMRLHNTDTGRRHIVCTYPGWAASWGILSGGALAWVGNSLYGLAPSDSHTLLPTSILKRLAMQSESVDHLRKEISRHKLCFTDGAFTFGDRCGAVAVLECVAGGNVWRDISTGWAVHANHAVLQSLIPYEDPRGGWGVNFRRDSKHRHHRLESLLAAAVATSESIDVATVKRLLADRGGDGFPICSHEDEAEIWTTAAYIVDLRHGLLWVSIGAPDSNAFIGYSFEDDATLPKL